MNLLQKGPNSMHYWSYYEGNHCLCFLSCYCRCPRFNIQIIINEVYIKFYVLQVKKWSIIYKTGCRIWTSVEPSVVKKYMNYNMMQFQHHNAAESYWHHQSRAEASEISFEVDSTGMEKGRKKNMTERLMRKEKLRGAAASLEPALQPWGGSRLIRSRRLIW